MYYKVQCCNKVWASNMTSHLFSGAVVLIAGLAFYLFVYRAPEEVTLNSKYGMLRGFESFSRDERIFFSFRAIPFAKPPIDELRFKPPVEIEKWTGIRDARIHTPVCLQADFIWKKILGQEDCLYLNIYTPKIPKSSGDKLLPVAVYFHGGYFMLGGSDIYDPSYFMDEDVVLVTFNYRLGAMGFLSTGDDVVSGNMGMKDQVMALKWVQSAISDFGGDPNLVTIFGQSAGGASVHFHMFSPLSKGLFHRVISQSGTSLCPWCDVEKDTEAQAKKLGETLNCSTESSEALVKCLRNMDGMKIIETQKSIFSAFYGPMDIYSPTLEKGKDTSKAFLTTSTRELYKSGKVTKIPWLSGVNSEEGSWKSAPIISDEENLAKLSKDWDTIAPNSFIYRNGSDVSDKILEQYFGVSKKIFTSDDFGKLADIFSERYFFTCQAEAGRLHSKYAPTYLYYFTHQNPESPGLGFVVDASKGKFPVLLELFTALVKRLIYVNVLGWEVRDFGVCHADELMYQFYTLPLSGIWKSSRHYDFSKSFVKLWVSFARDGFPGPFNGIKWEKVEPNKTPSYMHIGEPPGMVREPFTDKIKFWQNLQLSPK